MATDLSLDVLEDRMSSLEEKLLGSAGATAGNQKTKLIDDLVALNNKLATTVGSRDKLNEVLAQLPQINKYCDPAYADEISMPDESKWKALECWTPTLEKQIEQLQLLQQTRHALDSEHIRNAPSLRPKLAQVNERHTRLATDIAEHTDKVSDLLRTYNQLITSLSKHVFILGSSNH